MRVRRAGGRTARPALSTGLVINNRVYTRFRIRDATVSIRPIDPSIRVYIFFFPGERERRLSGLELFHSDRKKV